jgi:Bacterial regulatory protein, Fis family
MGQESDKSDINKKAMIEALERSLGIVTAACKAVNISRQTHYAWYHIDPDYKTAVDDILEIVIDFVESKLHKLINKGDTAATIFYLKTKGKSRGYIERQEININREYIKTFEIVPASRELTD